MTALSAFLGFAVFAALGGSIAYWLGFGLPGVLGAAVIGSVIGTGIGIAVHVAVTVGFGKLY